MQTGSGLEAEERSHYKIVKTNPVTLYMDCSTYSKT